MRLDLREIIHTPDARKTFQFQLDLSDLGEMVLESNSQEQEV